VRLTFEGQVKLLDFGVASAALEERSVTRIGQVKGKLTYMAPEQLAGSYDRRSDVFSLGVVLYELTTLSRFFGKSGLSIEERISFKEPVRPRLLVEDYPLELEAIVLKATATRPDDRYESAAAFGRALVDFVVEAGMRLSEEVLADFIAELVKLEREPKLANGTRPESTRDKDDSRAAQPGRDISKPTADVTIVDDGEDDAVYKRATSVLETLGADPSDVEFADPVATTPDAGEDAKLPTLDEISQRRKERMRTSNDAVLNQVPKLENTKSRRLHWQLAATVVFALAAAVAVAELLIQL
jgi:serine/threonine protein kinase